MRKIIVFIFSFLFFSILLAVPAIAQQNATGENQFTGGWKFSIRAAMTIGGDAPLSIPNEVNSIEKFTLQPGLAFGLYSSYRFHERWSGTVGLRYEMKRMKVAARTTHYPIVLINPDGGDLEGVWTGFVQTDANNSYISLPVTVSWHATRKWRLKGGLFLSCLVHRSFMGTVYDGYLRKDDPTGERLDIAYAQYDFTSGLRRWSWGFELGSALQLSRHFSLHGDITFGVNDIFRNDFTVLNFSLYPIYFNLGVEYTF